MWDHGVLTEAALAGDRAPAAVQRHRLALTGRDRARDAHSDWLRVRIYQHLVKKGLPAPTGLLLHGPRAAASALPQLREVLVVRRSRRLALVDPAEGVELEWGRDRVITTTSMEIVVEWLLTDSH